MLQRKVMPSTTHFTMHRFTRFTQDGEQSISTVSLVDESTWKSLKPSRTFLNSGQKSIFSVHFWFSGNLSHVGPEENVVAMESVPTTPGFLPCEAAKLLKSIILR